MSIISTMVFYIGLKLKINEDENDVETNIILFFICFSLGSIWFISIPAIILFHM